MATGTTRHMTEIAGGHIADSVNIRYISKVKTTAWQKPPILGARSMTVAIFTAEDEPIVGVPAIARAMGLPVRRVRYLLDIGELPAGKIGRTPFTKQRWLTERFDRQVSGNREAA